MRTQLALVTAFTLLASPAFAGDKVPTKLAIKDGETVKFHRQRVLHAKFDYTKKGQTSTLDNTAHMDLHYSILFNKTDKGFNLRLSITSAKLKYRSKYKEKERKGDWTMPKDAKPIVIELACNPQGRVQRTELTQSPRGAFREAGATNKTDKIPTLYLFGFRKRDYDGSFQGPFVLPNSAAKTFKVDFGAIYGLTDGLLDDLSFFAEKWSWQVGEAKAGLIPLTGKLESLKVDESSRQRWGTKVEKIESTSGKAQLDAKTGLLKSMDLKFKLKYSAQRADRPDRSIKGALTVSDKVTRE